MARLKDTEIDSNLAISGVHNLIYPGSILMWWKSDIPAGYKLCDGTLYTVANEPILYAAIGNIFGGDPGVDFNVPDLQEKHALGVNSTYTVNSYGGSLAHAHTLGHTHTLTSHSHNLNAHSHSVTAHNHTINSHSHTQNGHNHYVGFHDHSLTHSHTGTTGGPSTTEDCASGTISASSSSHTHSYTTGSNSDPIGDVALTTGSSSVATGLDSTDTGPTVAAPSEGNSDDTLSVASTLQSTTDNTSSFTTAFIVTNYIIRCI